MTAILRKSLKITIVKGRGSFKADRQGKTFLITESEYFHLQTWFKVWYRGLESGSNLCKFYSPASNSFRMPAVYKDMSLHDSAIFLSRSLAIECWQATGAAPTVILVGFFFFF